MKTPASPEFVTTLALHALAEVRCDHEAATDTAICNCARWASAPLASVQEAKEAWARHVWDVLPRAAECSCNSGSFAEFWTGDGWMCAECLEEHEATLEIQKAE